MQPLKSVWLEGLVLRASAAPQQKLLVFAATAATRSSIQHALAQAGVLVSSSVESVPNGRTPPVVMRLLNGSTITFESAEPPSNLRGSLRPWIAG